MAETYYFSHDYNARNTVKLRCLLRDWHAAGYGLFWILAERMHEDEQSCFVMDDLGLMDLASDAGITTDELLRFINDCVDKYKLFVKMDETSLTSERVMRNKEQRLDLRSKRAAAGRKGAESRWQKAESGERRAEREGQLAVDNWQLAKKREQKAEGREQEAEDAELRIAHATDAIAPATGNMANDGKGKERKEKEKKEIEGRGELRSHTTTTLSLEERELVFYNSLVPNVKTYGQALLRNFYNYWREPNKGRTKMRWECETTWDLSLRLERWAKNERHYDKNRQEQNTARLPTAQELLAQRGDT